MNWFRRCFMNWRWWVALPVIVLMAPAALVCLVYPFSWPWFNRLGDWTQSRPEQPEREAAES